MFEGHSYVCMVRTCVLYMSKSATDREKVKQIYTNFDTVIDLHFDPNT